MKRIFTTLIVIIFAFVLTPAIYSISGQKTINIEEKEVPYQLPHPGLLPDHPLYFFKIVRDRILIITTRDNFKKAKLYLHLSDKRIAASRRLSEKGKGELALDHATQAEETFLEIPPFLSAVKEQGGDTGDLVSELYQSNAKHRAVISEIIENITQTEIDSVDTLLKKNKEAKQALDNLQ